MKLGRTLAATAVLGALALPMTTAVGWADTAESSTAEPPRSAPAASEPQERPTEQAPQERPSEQAPQERPSERPTERKDLDDGRQRQAEDSPRTTVPMERQVTERPVGAPETGGDPAGWDATPVYVGGAVVAVVGAGTAVLLRRRGAGER
ncbi:hypothetical protein GCM10009676_15800 [Prauserella halophila]|uniref:Uncharacterized protein n=1 Tax=Prauserella halophila TaxID=185641 RepID=A0ABP4GQ18_9PSEU|nr:hypothetical protein [Prauserella halophila]MCP2236214.1 hypothetical protein [Prauserella halophila]